MFAQPIVEMLRKSRRILLAGCGGGYDVFGAVPLLPVRTSLFCCLVPLLACAARVTVPASRIREGEPSEPAGPSLVLPPLVVAADTVLGLPEDDRVGLAFPRNGLPLTVREIQGMKVLVVIDGPVRVAGVARLENLGVAICEPGPVGEHGYAGNGDLLHLRSGIVDGQVRVAGEAVGVPFEGEIALSRICLALPPPGPPDPNDFPEDGAIIEVEKGVALTLLDAPGGKPFHTVPASEEALQVVRVANEGGWDLVAVGGGPYLVGWIPARAPRGESSPEEEGVMGGLFLGSGPMALYTRDLADLPLHTLPAGTELELMGVARATLDQPGYARVVRTEGKRSLVVAAVDEDIKVQGWIDTAKLGEAVAAGQ